MRYLYFLSIIYLFSLSSALQCMQIRLTHKKPLCFHEKDFITRDLLKLRNACQTFENSNDLFKQYPEIKFVRNAENKEQNMSCYEYAMSNLVWLKRKDGTYLADGIIFPKKDRCQDLETYFKPRKGQPQKNDLLAYRDSDGDFTHFAILIDPIKLIAHSKWGARPELIDHHIFCLPKFYGDKIETYKRRKWVIKEQYGTH